MTIWELNDDDNNQSKWRVIHQLHLSDMKATPSAFATIVDNPKASPYSKEHRRTWVGNFLESAVAFASTGIENVTQRSDRHDMICVGFDPTLPDVIYLLLCPPGYDSLAALASYNMQSRVIEVVPESTVPHQLRRLRSLDAKGFHHVCPFVLQPWPTPLPKVASAPSL